MSQHQRVPLSVRISLVLVFASILPLLITVGFSEWQIRPELTSQSSAAMESDAQTRVQLIDAYFNERLLDTQTLTQIPSVQTFLAAMPSQTPEYQDLAIHAAYSLIAGSIRDKHYTNWSLFGPKGDLRLYNPEKASVHGQYTIPPTYLQQVTALKSFISAVYYTPSTQKASVDLYAPVMDANRKLFLGFTRASLNLDSIWSIVQDDTKHGSGSYAFILDENGVRIADPDPSQRFTAIAPLEQQTQHAISNEARYGGTSAPPVHSDTALASHFHVTTSSTTFQAQPAGKSEDYQIVQYKTKTVPWTYFVLSPISTVIHVANRQLLFTGIIALLVSAIAAAIGLIVGRRISYPIMNSVEYLRNNSHALTTLAAKQKDASSEQMWVVDASRVGLQSVQYYTDATQLAARQLNDIGIELAQHWQYLDAYRIRQRLGRIITTAQYIENATQYQGSSNQKLSTALKVATQVTEQLATGATSATDTATQLEQVVEQLRYVVGK